MSAHFDDFAPVMVAPPSTPPTHRCRFDDERHVVCSCGWVSLSVGAPGAQESFDHIFSE